MEEWNLFTRKWVIFKDGSHNDDKNSSHHLFQCADGLLGNALLKTDPEIVSTDLMRFAGNEEIIYDSN